MLLFVTFAEDESDCHVVGVFSVRSFAEAKAEQSRQEDDCRTWIEEHDLDAGTGDVTNYDT